MVFYIFYFCHCRLYLTHFVTNNIRIRCMFWVRLGQPGCCHLQEFPREIQEKFVPNCTEDT